MPTIRCKNPYFKGSPHGVKFTPATGGAVAKASAEDAEKILKDYPNSMVLEDAQEADAPAATPSPNDSEPPVVGGHSGIEAIKGIGPKMADELALAGIRTVAQLAEASTDAIVKATGVKQEKAFDWHLQANELMSDADGESGEDQEDA
jgi:predicted flap endonuclease-1-like 5' DNA nuclease